MSKHKEGKIQAAIVAEAEAMGFIVYNIVVSGKKGNGDLCMCANGRFMSIEVKVEGEEPTPMQLYKLKKIREARGLATWCTSVAEFRAFVVSCLREGLEDF